MNPLVSVLLGIFFLKEQLSGAQQIAFLLATTGVMHIDVFIWNVSMVGIRTGRDICSLWTDKEAIKLDALRGMTIETLFIVPFALTLLHMVVHGWTSVNFYMIDVKTDILLILTGAATALPLVMYAKGVQRIPLYMAGFFNI